MAKKRVRNPEAPNRTAATIGSNLQADYSYSQWRHAQMQQLERNYRAVCERQFSHG
jgi:hypothetical protein